MDQRTFRAKLHLMAPLRLMDQEVREAPPHHPKVLPRPLDRGVKGGLRLLLRVPPFPVRHRLTVPLHLPVPRHLSMAHFPVRRQVFPVRRQVFPLRRPLFQAKRINMPRPRTINGVNPRRSWLMFSRCGHCRGRSKQHDNNMWRRSGLIFRLCPKPWPVGRAVPCKLHLAS